MYKCMDIYIRRGMYHYIQHFLNLYITHLTYIHLITTNTHTNYIPELSCCLHETLSGPWLGNDALSGQVDRTSGVFFDYF